MRALRPATKAKNASRARARHGKTVGAFKCFFSPSPTLGRYRTYELGTQRVSNHNWQLFGPLRFGRRVKCPATPQILPPDSHWSQPSCRQDILCRGRKDPLGYSLRSRFTGVLLIGATS